MAFAVVLIAALGVLLRIRHTKSAEHAATYKTAATKAPSGSKIQNDSPRNLRTAGGKSWINPDQKVATSDKPVTKSFCAPIEKICFDYPEKLVGWQDSVDVDNDSVAEKLA